MNKSLTVDKATTGRSGLTNVLYGRYKCAIHDSMLWVTCMSCTFDVFTWNSSTAFGITLLDGAIKRHEAQWHKSVTS